MEKKNINRRDFIKIVGISTATVSGLFYGCGKGKSEEGAASGPAAPVPVDKMTYRISERGDQVSLLGYGCMRWPTLPSPAGDGNVIDQDAVNELCNGSWSELLRYIAGICAGMVREIYRYSPQASSEGEILCGYKVVELLELHTRELHQDV